MTEFPSGLCSTIASSLDASPKTPNVFATNEKEDLNCLIQAVSRQDPRYSDNSCFTTDRPFDCLSAAMSALPSMTNRYNPFSSANLASGQPILFGNTNPTVNCPPLSALGAAVPRRPEKSNDPIYVKNTFLSTDGVSHFTASDDDEYRIRTESCDAVLEGSRRHKLSLVPPETVPEGLDDPNDSDDFNKNDVLLRDHLSPTDDLYSDMLTEVENFHRESIDTLYDYALYNTHRSLSKAIHLHQSEVPTTVKPETPYHADFPSGISCFSGTQTIAHTSDYDFYEESNEEKSSTALAAAMAGLPPGTGFIDGHLPRHPLRVKESIPHSETTTTTSYPNNNFNTHNNKKASFKDNSSENFSPSESSFGDPQNSTRLFRNVVLNPTANSKNKFRTSYTETNRHITLPSSPSSSSIVNSPNDILPPSTGMTTIMLRNIPNKYTQKMLLDVIDQNFIRLYDFFYLPIDFRNKCNVGYAFINFIHSHYATMFKEQFHGLKLGAFKSNKVCEVSWGRVQGLATNIEHYRNSAVMSIPIPQYKPMIFKNGMMIPFPIADGPLPSIKLRPQKCHEKTS